MLFIVIFWYLEYEYVEILQVTFKTIWKKTKVTHFLNEYLIFLRIKEDKDNTFSNFYTKRC